MFDIIQTIVIGCVVTASAWYAFKWVFPASYRLWIGRLSFILQQPQRTASMRRLGRWLQPSADLTAACGTDVCSKCKGCGSSK